MTQEKAVSLIRNAVESDQLQYWADLGSGTFPKALAAVLPAGSAISLDIMNFTNLINKNWEKYISHQIFTIVSQALVWCLIYRQGRHKVTPFISLLILVSLIRSILWLQDGKCR